MKNYIKQHHISLILLIISLITLFLMVKPDISNYLHQKEIANLNKNRYINALKYYEELSTEIKSLDLNKPFSRVKCKQCMYDLSSTCSYIVTDDVKNDKWLVDLFCADIVTDIYGQLISLDSELKRAEILDNLDKLKDRVRTLMQN